MFDIYVIITMFYTIEEMTAIVGADKNFMLHSHQKFNKDLFAFRAKFNSAFAKMLYDYMVYVIMGEVIESRRFCDLTFDRMLGGDSRYVTSDNLEKEYKRMDPENLLAHANEVFNSYWNGMFGGPSWVKAVGLTKLFGKVPDILFIDGLIDLQHNTDSILSKRNPYWEVRRNPYWEVRKSQCKKLIVLLNRKRKNKLWITQNIICINQSFPVNFKKLLLRFISLYLPEWDQKDIFLENFWETHNNKYLEEFLNYKPTEYTYEFILGQQVLSDDLDDEDYEY